jgi:hypothetical protein
MTVGLRMKRQSRGGNSSLTYSLFLCGYVTEALNAGQPKEVTADRVDMTHDIMEKHYDKATKKVSDGAREDYLIDV